MQEKNMIFSLKQTCHSQTGGRGGGSPTWEKFPHFPGWQRPLYIIIRAGGLSTSDRIVEVDGVRLDSADHEKAVAAIKVNIMMIKIALIALINKGDGGDIDIDNIQGAPDAIIFMVQSLHNWVMMDADDNEF